MIKGINLLRNEAESSMLTRALEPYCKQGLQFRVTKCDPESVKLWLVATLPDGVNPDYSLRTIRKAIAKEHCFDISNTLDYNVYIMFRSKSIVDEIKSIDGEKVKALIAEYGLRNVEVADMLGISNSTLSCYLNNSKERKNGARVNASFYYFFKYINNLQ